MDENVKNQIQNIKEDVRDLKAWVTEFEIVNALLNINTQIAAIKTELDTNKQANIGVISSTLQNIELGFSYIQRRAERTYLFDNVKKLGDNIAKDLLDLRKQVDSAKDISKRTPKEMTGAAGGPMGSTFGD